MLLPLGISLAIISVVGLGLNGYILLVLLLTKQASPNNILLIHLSVTQTLLSIVFLVFSFPPIFHHGIWIESIQFPCDINGFFLTLLHPLALWTICGLNCDRFYAIAMPLHYSAIVTNRKVITGLISGWIVIFSLTIPPFFKVAPYTFSTNMTACIPNFATLNSLWYAIVFTFVTVIIPGIVIIGCNIKVLMIARYHRHRIAAAIYEVTLSAQVTITHQRNPFFVPTVTAPSAGGPKFRSRSPIASVLQLAGSFVILYLPYYISIIWDTVAVQVYGTNVPENLNKTKEYLILVAQSLLTSSTIFNAILYGLKSKTIRKTFQNYWRKQRTKNEINQEIQARTPSTCGSRRPSVTNIGFLTRPLLQRRLSETLIDFNRSSSGNGFSNGIHHHRAKMKRIASELTWRPISLTFAGLESPTASRSVKIQPLAHTSSCNTLQVPTTDTEMISEADKELYESVRKSFRAAKLTENPRKSINYPLGTDTDNSISDNEGTTCTSSHQEILSATKSSNPLGAANYLLHKVLRLDNHQHTKRLKNLNHNNNNYNNSSNNNIILTDNKRTVFNSPMTSPRILITRAFSDDSESKTPSLPGSPAKDMKAHRQYSSSTNITEKSSSIWKDNNNFERARDNDIETKKQDQNDSLDNNQECNFNKNQILSGDVDSSECDSKRIDITSGSNSTTLSELSHRKYSSMEETSCYSKDYDSATEEQLLLSWPTTRKKMKIYNSGGGTIRVKHGSTLGSGIDNSKNGLYRPSPLFNDRCEEPEVIL